MSRTGGESHDRIERLHRMQELLDQMRRDMLNFVERSRSMTADMKVSSNASAERAAHARALARAALRRADVRRQESSRLTALLRGPGREDSQCPSVSERVEAGAFEG
jgi:hypothetical protein